MPVKEKRVVSKAAYPKQSNERPFVPGDIALKAHIVEPQVLTETEEKEKDRKLVYEFSDHKIYEHEDGRLYWENGVMLNRQDRRRAGRKIEQIQRRLKNGQGPHSGE